MGHENASAATGTVTFYNGLFTAHLVPQGTVFTGSDGIQVMTNADVSIPAGNPRSMDRQAYSLKHFSLVYQGILPQETLAQ